MGAAMVLGLGLVMLGTAFLSGIFGMAGGLVLIGILLALLPVPEAMALHAVTQMASNVGRGVLWIRYVRWPAVAAYVTGCVVALAGFAVVLLVPDRPVALLLLGLSPFLARLLPKGFRLNPERSLHGVLTGMISMALMLLTGVAGPLLDTFFLGGTWDRRRIIATKAICQVFGHGLKLLYFGGLVAEAGRIDPLLAAVAVAASLLGTSLAKRVLLAMSDAQYRLWAGRIITAIGLFYLAHGTWLLAAPVLAQAAL